MKGDKRPDKRIAKRMISHMGKQSLKASRLRNIFVMVTVALAAALLTGILMFAAGQRTETRRALSGAWQAGFYDLTDDQVNTLKNDGRISYQIQSKQGVPSSMDGFDVVPYYVSGLSDEIKVGELESGELPKKENEIAAQGTMLELMGVEAKEGSEVSFTFYDGSKETFTVSGILAGGEGAKQFPVFFPETYAENGSQLKDEAYTVYAKFYGAESMGREQCKDMIYQVGQESGLEKKQIGPSNQFLNSIGVSMEQTLVYILAGMVILLACVLVIYGVFYLSVVGRVHQFGQLRAIGMTRKQMRRLVSMEGRLLFLRAAPVGLVIGGIAGYFIIPGGFGIINTLIIMALVLAIVYVITCVSVRKPAKIAASVSPVEALRYVPWEGMKKAAGKKVCRKLTSGSLGVMNFGRNRKKATITLLSLCFGGILFMAAATYISSFDKEVYVRSGFGKGEFSIYHSQAAIELNENGLSGLQAEKPLDEALISEIKAIDGVTKVDTVQNFGVKFDSPKNNEYGNDDQLSLFSNEEIKSMGQYLAEGGADYDKMMSGDYVLVNNNDVMEEIYGWRFEVDDKIILHYYDGNKTAEKEVEVLGILNEEFTKQYPELDGWFVLPEKSVTDWLTFDTLNAELRASVEEDKEAAAGEELENLVSKHAELAMDTLAERRASYESAISRIFGAISGLSIFIMLFSILSMMNTLITNIVTRKQELAMLESIGMSKKQRRKMLLSESFLLAGVTVGVTMTLGTLCGYGLCEALTGVLGVKYMVFQFPTMFAAAYAAALAAIPLLITLVSMYSFSKEGLVERLRGNEC